MSYDEIYAQLGEKPELLTFLKGDIAKREETVNGLIKTNNSLELTNKDVIQSRNKYKSIAKDLTGSDSLDEDSINKFKDSIKNTKIDEKSQLEIDNLKTLMGTNKDDFIARENAFVSEIRDLKSGSNLQKLISESGMIDDGLARGDMQKIVKAQMSYNEKNEAIFLDTQGVTKYNADGTVFGIPDAIKQALTERAYWQGKTVVDGAGSQNNDGGSQQEQKLDTSKYKSTDSFMADAMKTVTQK